MCRALPAWCASLRCRDALAGEIPPPSVRAAALRRQRPEEYGKRAEPSILVCSDVCLFSSGGSRSFVCCVGVISLFRLLLL